MNLKPTISTAIFVSSFLFLTSCGSKAPGETVSGDGTKTEATSSSADVTKEFLIGKNWKAETGHGSAPFSQLTFTADEMIYATGKDSYTLVGNVLDMSAYHIKYTLAKDGDGFYLILDPKTKFKYNAEGGSTSTTTTSTTETNSTETKTPEVTTSSTSSSTSAPKFKVGDKIEVYDAAYEKKWFGADILKVKDGKYYIHYHGYDSKWDIWATENHVRAAR